MSSVFHDILQAIASAMEVPVVIGLILFIAFTLFSIGWWAVEYFRERRHMQVSLPALLDQLRASEMHRSGVQAGPNAGPDGHADPSRPRHHGLGSR